MHAELLDIDNDRWDALLGRARHDVDHLPQYLAAHDEFRGNVSRLAVVEDDVGALFVPLRLIESGGKMDASSSEVRSAPLFTAGAPPGWRREAIRELLALLDRHNVVSLFLRFHPLLDSSVTEFSRFGAVVEHGETFNIPLTRSLDEIRAAMSKTHRRGIRKFAAAKYEYRPDPKWRALPEFYEIYRHTMARVGATDDFHFSLEFFERLRDDLGEHVSLWTLEADGQLALGSIVTECNGIAQGLYGAVHPDFYGEIPQIGAYDAEIAWALERGASDYFFDGAATESLRQFKERMTEHRPVASSARIVIDPIEYGRRCAEWELKTGRSVDHIDGFFPPYRSGVSMRGESMANERSEQNESATIGAQARS